MAEQQPIPAEMLDAATKAVFALGYKRETLGLQKVLEIGLKAAGVPALLAERDGLQWIRVEEKLPPLDEWVLVWLDEENRPDVDKLVQLSPSDGGGVQLTHWYLHNITHWRPVGDRPKPISKNAEQPHGGEESE